MQVLKVLAIAVCSCGMAGGWFSGDAVAASPNVLLIMTDDQGFGDVRSHGNPYIDTPVHDRIAAEGIRFDRFFVSPVCAPTRASLLTGRWHLRTGVHGVTRGRETMRSSETTIAEIFRDAGYATGAFGKWHNGGHYPHHPNGQGFDQFVGFCAGHWNNYFDGQFERNGTREQFDGFIIDRLTDEAIKFIESNSEQPWFCYVPYNTPHSPWQVPERLWQKYVSQNIGDPRATCAYAMVENIDSNMGRLLDVLERYEIEENTIVIFLTDNGANSPRFNAGMKGRKGSLHEGGTRVPCFLRWPKTIPGERTIPQIASHIDLLPTIAELAGIEIPSDWKLDGRSLVPLIDDENTDWQPRNLFAHWGDDATGKPTAARGAIRNERWRAVKYKNKWELYDMRADPSQLNDLAQRQTGTPEAGILGTLVGEYDRWFADVTSSGFAPIATEIGHDEARSVALPGHEAILLNGRFLNETNPRHLSGISYVGRAGWANDWVTNWTDANAFPRWPIKIVTAGTYTIQLECSVPESSIGGKIQIRVGDRMVETIIESALEAKQIDSPDRVKRGEVYEKKWPRLTVGDIGLSKGESALSVHPVDMVGDRFIDLKAVHVIRPNP
ncbi:arylsulfatase [Planctomycetota bacterium]